MVSHSTAFPFVTNYSEICIISILWYSKLVTEKCNVKYVLN